MNHLGDGADLNAVLHGKGQLMHQIPAIVVDLPADEKERIAHYEPPLIIGHVGPW